KLKKNNKKKTKKKNKKKRDVCKRQGLREAGGRGVLVLVFGRWQGWLCRITDKGAGKKKRGRLLFYRGAFTAGRDHRFRERFSHLHLQRGKGAPTRGKRRRPSTKPTKTSRGVSILTRSVAWYVALHLILFC
ncbi:hypothetical protein V8G54_010676, partial [Vigna mungo]